VVERPHRRDAGLAKLRCALTLSSTPRLPLAKRILASYNQGFLFYAAADVSLPTAVTVFPEEYV
jgi:hypothetical protein